MWFLSKQKYREKTTQFLRKSLPEKRKHRGVEKKHGQHNVVGILLLWILFFGTLFYTAFFSLFFLTGEPRITGMSEISEKTLSDFVDATLAKKYFQIFSRHNFFLVHPKDLENQLRREYPLLASVSVTRVFPDGLRIEVTERKKIILWYSKEQSFLIDENGIAHDSAQALLPENEKYILSVTDMSNKEVALDDKVFDADYGVFVVQVNELFSEQLGMTLESRYTTVSRFADELRAKTNEGWAVYFGTDIQIESSLTVLKLLFEKELSKEQRTKLAYIDLRAENRAYYAYREGEGISAPVEASPALGEKKVETPTKEKKQK